MDSLQNTLTDWIVSIHGMINKLALGECIYHGYSEQSFIDGDSELTHQIKGTAPNFTAIYFAKNDKTTTPVLTVELNAYSYSLITHRLILS